MRLDTNRQLGGDLFHLVRHGLAEDEVIAALSHRDGEANRRLAIKSEHRLGRIGITLFYCRHIGETEEFAARKQIDPPQIVNRAKRSGNADRKFFQAGLDNAGGRDGVLLL